MKTKNSVFGYNLRKGVGLRDFGMQYHLAKENLHSAKYTGFFVCKGKPLHDRELVAESHTERKGYHEFGKCSQYFYLNEPKSPTFKTIDELLEYYNEEEK